MPMSVRARRTRNDEVLRERNNEKSMQKKISNDKMMPRYVRQLFKAVLRLSLVATYPHARTSSYPAHQVVDLQKLVEGPWAPSVASREGRRSQDPSSTAEKTSCFAASVPVTTIVAVVVVVVAAAVVPRTYCTEFDAAVPGGGREDGRRHPLRPHVPIAIGKIRNVILAIQAVYCLPLPLHRRCRPLHRYRYRPDQMLWNPVDGQSCRHRKSRKLPTVVWISSA